MTFTRLALALAATGIAVNLLMKNRRGPVASHDGLAPDAAATNTAVPPTASDDSPNAAERLQAQGLAETAGSRQSGDDVLGPNGQGDSDAIRPGMPDLTRGA